MNHETRRVGTSSICDSVRKQIKIRMPELIVVPLTFMPFTQTCSSLINSVAEAAKKTSQWRENCPHNYLFIMRSNWNKIKEQAFCLHWAWWFNFGAGVTVASGHSVWIIALDLFSFFFFILSSIHSNSGPSGMKPLTFSLKYSRSTKKRTCWSSLTG